MFATEQIANITDTEVFDSKMGLKIAVALTSWTTNAEMELDKEYGRIVFNRNDWTTFENGTIFSNKDEIPSHVCTKEELGLD